jgi:hypothetical protein
MKRCSMSTRLHGATSQKTASFINIVFAPLHNLDLMRMFSVNTLYFIETLKEKPHFLLSNALFSTNKIINILLEQ